MVTLTASEITGAAPQRGVARSIVAMAMRAPSLHNTQPWRWRICSENTLELYADHDRQLHGVDPRGRLMMLSLGSALHHAVVAARSGDRAVRVERLPDGGPPDLVARLHLEGRSPSRPEDRIALASLVARRTDRRPFSSWEVPDETLQRLAEVSTQAGAPAVVLDVRQRVAVEHLVSTASVLQASRRLVEREHARWWAIEPRATYDGVPADLVPDRVVDPLGRGRDGAGALDGRAGSPPARHSARCGSRPSPRASAGCRSRCRSRSPSSASSCARACWDSRCSRRSCCAWGGRTPRAPGCPAPPVVPSTTCSCPDPRPGPTPGGGVWDACPSVSGQPHGEDQ